MVRKEEKLVVVRRVEGGWKLFRREKSGKIRHRMSEDSRGWKMEYVRRGEEC